jgi:acetyltransferase-like isoleucine patch superfamily enzyme
VAAPVAVLHRIEQVPVTIRIHRAIEATVNIVRLIRARCCARCLAVRGASIGAKTQLAPGLRVDRPWCVTIGTRCQLEQDVWLKIVDNVASVRIGDYTFLGRGVEIDASSEVVIGNRVLIAPEAFITDHAHRIEPGRDVGEQGCFSASVVIEDGVWLGVRSIVLPGVRIGQGAIVGAGAVVTRHVPPFAVVAGVPARVLRFRNSEDRAT